jgi:hypothetical protein
LSLEDAMIYRALADIVLVTHFTFAAFTLLGGLLVLRWRSLLWAHLPTLLWGVVIQWANLTCPLTPLESRLRHAGGEAGYAGGFIEHYVSMVLYPENLTVELRYLLGAALMAVNLLVYGYMFLRLRHRAPEAAFVSPAAGEGAGGETGEAL